MKKLTLIFLVIINSMIFISNSYSDDNCNRLKKFCKNSTYFVPMPFVFGVIYGTVAAQIASNKIPDEAKLAKILVFTACIATGATIGATATVTLLPLTLPIGVAYAIKKDKEKIKQDDENIVLNNECRAATL